MFDELIKFITEFSKKLYDTKMNLTKEEKAEYIQCLRNNNISPLFVCCVFEFLDEEEFIKHELFILEHQHVEIYLQDKVVDAIKKNYPDDNSSYLYNRGYIQGVRAERARIRVSPFYGLKHKIMIQVNLIESESTLKGILAYVTRAQELTVGGACNG